MDFEKKMMSLPFLSENAKSTLLMRAFGLTKVPLLFFCSPRVTEISNASCQVRMPFRKIIKNHLGSVYFGALAIGADTCVGMLAMDKIRRSNRPISLVFKDFKANFLKRAEGDTLFVCDAGLEMDQLIERVLSTGERQNQTFPARALVQGEIVAEFELTLSLKLR